VCTWHLQRSHNIIAKADNNSNSPGGLIDIGARGSSLLQLWFNVKYAAEETKLYRGPAWG